MADRTVSVKLRLEASSYVAGIRQAKAATNDLAKSAVQHARTHKQAYHDAGLAIATFGAAGVAALALATHAAANFEKEMSGVRAVSNATAGDMSKLRNAALQAGKATAFTASDAARAEAELAKAGVSTADILGGGLTGSLSLAAAGQLELADAATISAQAMNIFKLGGSQVGHIADVLAAGANKSAADVGQLGDALRQGGLLAAQTGLSLEDTVGALSAFADNALIGSDAGTSLKTMLQRLTPQSQEAEDMMKQLGLSAYDAQGNFVGLEKFAGNLRASMVKLTPQARNAAMAVIFGSDAVRAANILYEEGAAGVRDYTKAVDDHGAAARMAAIQMDNLSGDIEQLKGSIETALIKSGSSGNKVLREMAQAANAAVGAYLDLPAPAQNAATAVVAIGSGIALVGGAALIAIPKVLAFDASLKTLTGGAVGAKTAMSGLGKAGLIAAAVFGAFEATDFAADKLAGAAPSVDAMTSSLLDFAREGKTAGALAKVVGSNFDDLAQTVKDANESKWFDWKPGGPSIVAITKARKELESLDKSLAELVTSGHADDAKRAFDAMAQTMRMSGVSEKDIAKQFNDYQAALDNVTVTSKKASVTIGGVSGALQEEAAKTKAASDALNAHADALKALYSPTFAMQKALRDQADAQADVTKAIKEHGRGSKQAEDALFALASANVDVTASADALAAQLTDGGVSAAQMTGQLKTWVAQGLLTQAQADTLAGKIKTLQGAADKFGQTNVTAQVHVAGVPAAHAQIAQLKTELDRLIVPRSLLPDGRPAVPKQPTSVDNYLDTLAGPKGKPKKKADGGWITGPGGPRDDVIPAWLSNGEFVVKASAAGRNAGLLEAINGGRGYASGGWVRGTSQGGMSAAQVDRIVAAVKGARPVHVTATQARASAAEIVDEAVFAARAGRL